MSIPQHSEEQKVKWLWHENKNKKDWLLKVNQMSLQGVSNLLLSCSVNLRNERKFSLQGRLQRKQNSH